VTQWRTVMGVVWCLCVVLLVAALWKLFYVLRAVLVLYLMAHGGHLGAFSGFSSPAGSFWGLRRLAASLLPGMG